MGVQRAVVVDRDAMLLSRLAAELGRSGYAVETLASTLGLTPDLLELSEPDLLLIDAELPGMDRAGLLVIARSLKARRSLQIIISTDGEPAAFPRQIAADRVLRRSELLARGASALGLSVAAESKLDLRELLDRVLGHQGAAKDETLTVQVDLFSKSNFYAAPGTARPAGVFFATAVLLPVGQRVTLELKLLERPPVRAVGDVAWQRPHSSFGGRMPTGVGIRFVELPAPDREAIDRFLEVREPFMGAN